MNESRELIQIRQLPTSKADILEFSNKLQDALEAGTMNPLDLLLRFKGIEKINEAVKEVLTKSAVTEAQKYPEKEVVHGGGVFKVAEFGTKYIFESCGDVRWFELKTAADAAIAELKARETFLKTINGSETIVDQSSGEIVTIYAPIKTSTTGISCSIK